VPGQAVQPAPILQPLTGVAPRVVAPPTNLAPAAPPQTAPILHGEPGATAAQLPPAPPMTTSTGNTVPPDFFSNPQMPAPAAGLPGGVAVPPAPPIAPASFGFADGMFGTQGIRNPGIIAGTAGDFARSQSGLAAQQGVDAQQGMQALSGTVARQAQAYEGPNTQVLTGSPTAETGTTLSRLRAFDAGAGPSVAEAQLRQQADKDFSNALALSRSGAGSASGRAWAQRAATAENFQRTADTNRSAGVLRAGEEQGRRQMGLQALGAEAGLASAADSQTLQAGTQQVNANLQGQQLANTFKLGSQELAAQTAAQGAQLGMQGQSQASALGMQGYGVQMGAAEAAIDREIQARQLNEQIKAGERGYALQVDALQDQKDAMPWQIGASVVGSGLGMAGAMLSDKRAKTAIQRLAEDDDLAEEIASTPAFRWKYKPGLGEDSETEYASAMAGDIEQGRYGRSAVKTGADGLKRVDAGRLTAMTHAGLGSALRRIKALEEAAA
jgi:hypothetical protein